MSQQKTAAGCDAWSCSADGDDVCSVVAALLCGFHLDLLMPEDDSDGGCDVFESEQPTSTARTCWVTCMFLQPTAEMHARSGALCGQ